MCAEGNLEIEKVEIKIDGKQIEGAIQEMAAMVIDMALSDPVSYDSSITKCMHCGEYADRDGVMRHHEKCVWRRAYDFTNHRRVLFLARLKYGI